MAIPTDEELEVIFLASCTPHGRHRPGIVAIRKAIVQGLADDARFRTVLDYAAQHGGIEPFQDWILAHGGG